MTRKTIIVIGAGFAGLSAGCYAQMNGYSSEVFEMHNQPGGLCTSWKRKGYTIDGCIHWLVGSSPKNSFYRFWQEVGIAQGREFIDSNVYAYFEGSDGRTFIFYADPDRLEKHMLELSPADADLIKEFTDGVRFSLRFNPPSGAGSAIQRLVETAKFMMVVSTSMNKLRRYLKTTTRDYVSRLKDPLLKEAFTEMWFPEFSLFFMMYTMAHIHLKNAGYPIGGSTPMSEALEKRYLQLGGKVRYGCRVNRILVEDNRAVGVRLEDGSEHRADIVISAADGHATIFDMLEGKYIDDTIRGYYEKMPIFPPLIFVGVGVDRKFDDVPKSIAGINIPLKEPVEIGEKMRERLSVHIFNQDPTLAPAGKTVLTVMMNSDYTYWKQLRQDPAAYNEKKDQISRTIVYLLDQRFPGLANQVEMTDVATPVTFERYTGNWQGSFEGWLMTPETGMMQMKNILPGLANFYMVGQWVQPGGGLPTGVMTGRTTLQKICKEDKVKFTTTIA